MAATPELRVEAACAELGRDEVVRRCLQLLAGDDGEPDFIVALGGPPAARLLTLGLPAPQAYWVRVWAARGLLWTGVDGSQTARLRCGLRDEAWRVREMTCKVIARHRLRDLLEDVAALESDAVPRVRTAAARAAVRILSGPS